MEFLNYVKQVPMPILILIMVVLVVITLVIAVQYIKLKKLDGIREDVYKLFLRAEHVWYESDQGKQKMKWVIQQARMLLPNWAKFFITDTLLEKVLEKWFRGVKDLLDDGKVNNSQESAEAGEEL